MKDVVHFSDFEMTFVRSREEVKYKMRLTELIDRLDEVDEVPKRADLSFWFGDLVVYLDWFVAGHNYWNRDTDFETCSCKHMDPCWHLDVHWHNIEVSHVPSGRPGEVYLSLKDWMACLVPPRLLYFPFVTVLAYYQRMFHGFPEGHH